MFSSSSTSPLLFSIFISALILFTNVEARGGRRGGKGRGKTNLQFAQVAEFSLISSQLPDNRVELICKAYGEPRPMIKWYKEGAEMQPKPNVHYYEKPLSKNKIWSKLEIDPATMGDQGIYACVANNQYGVMAKNFKAEYTY
ncbi:unnamed protein product [Meloidogyne enterolobii]|uniref:Uncharacterized protein n=1 Tax=Meloidogyne enterolobii TaxID=390850 RepID=A0ACB1ARB7_MELEN